jgi:acyl-CoA reductase-like NAD-dependent aldehyde dehydrogenase
MPTPMADVPPSGRTVPAYGRFVDGGWRGDTEGIENRNPAAPGTLVSTHGAATATDVDEAYAAARAAAAGWRRTSPVKRGEILYRAAELLAARTEQIAAELTAEEGKTLAEARGEAGRAVSILRFYAGECSQPTGDMLPSAADDTLLYSIREPLGVVCIITPWNFPIAIPTWKIAPALAYGNTVVFKPSDLTPLCAVRLVEALDEAGLPPGVINLLTGMPADIGDALTGHAEVDGISFTGSNPVGRAIQAAAVPRGVKVQLELGGKNPVIVLADADLDVAVEQTLRGAMFSTGQKCTATSRAILHPSIADEFTERMLAATQALTVGDGAREGVKMGPLVSRPQRDRVLSYLDVARDEGHSLLTGGGAGDGDGWFVQPTIYDGVTPTSRIGQEEIFGPVLGLMRADTLEDALAIANSVDFGLSASLFTRDLRSALAFAREAEVGVVHVNSETAGAEPQAPFGGMKRSSSHSREQGKAAVHFFTETKTVYITG